MNKPSKHFPPATNEWPQVITQEATENGYCLQMAIDDKIHWFQGHFPQQAVLPGVVQVHWAASMIKHYFAIEENFSKVGNLKFKTMILPDTQLSLSLEASKPHSVKFHYYNDDNSFSSGTLYFKKP